MTLFPTKPVALSDVELLVSEIVTPDMSEYPGKGFIESIKRLGVLEPIIVENTDEGVEIVDGKRRYWAAREAGLETIPAKLKTDETNAHLIALTGNNARSNNPLDEYRRLRALLDAGHTLEGVCKAVQLNLKTARKLLSTGDRLIDDIKQAVADDGISWSAAEVIATVTPERQGKVYEEYIEKGEFTLKRARELKTAIAQQNAAPEISMELFIVPEDPGIARNRAAAAIRAAKSALEAVPASAEVNKWLRQLDTMASKFEEGAEHASEG